MKELLLVLKGLDFFDLLICFFRKVLLCFVCLIFVYIYVLMYLLLLFIILLKVYGRVSIYLVSRIIWVNGSKVGCSLCVRSY